LTARTPIKLDRESRNDPKVVLWSNKNQRRKTRQKVEKCKMEGGKRSLNGEKKFNLEIRGKTVLEIHTSAEGRFLYRMKCSDKGLLGSLQIRKSNRAGGRKNTVASSLVGDAGRCARDDPTPNQKFTDRAYGRGRAVSRGGHLLYLIKRSSCMAERGRLT